MAFSYTIP